MDADEKTFARQTVIHWRRVGLGLNLRSSACICGFHSFEFSHEAWNWQPRQTPILRCLRASAEYDHRQAAHKQQGPNPGMIVKRLPPEQLAADILKQKRRIGKSLSKIERLLTKEA